MSAASAQTKAGLSSMTATFAIMIDAGGFASRRCYAADRYPYELTTLVGAEGAVAPAHGVRVKTPP